MPSLRLSLAFFLVALIALLLYVGCADKYDLGVDWNKRIGNYSYADMVDDFGPPWATQTNSDYSKSCQWPVYSGHDYKVYSKVHGRDFEIYDFRHQRIPHQMEHDQTIGAAIPILGFVFPRVSPTLFPCQNQN
jgi:hypothetical protein